MTTRTLDAGAFNAFEQQGWQQSADPYDRYFGALTAQAGVALLAALDDSPRDKALLDLATGPGYLALRAADLGYGPVVGIDFSDAMIALARDAARACNSTAQFRLGNAEGLAEPDAAFDTVCMNFGLLHLGQPHLAIAEALRVLKPGGRFGFSVWAEPARSAGFAIILQAIDAWADKSVPIPEGPPFFHFSNATLSTEAMQAAGFIRVDVRTLDLQWRLESGDELFNAFLHGTARTGGMLRAQTPETLAAIRQSVRRDADRFQSASGLRIPMSVVLVTGTRPAN